MRSSVSALALFLVGFSGLACSSSGDGQVEPSDMSTGGTETTGPATNAGGVSESAERRWRRAGE